MPLERAAAVVVDQGHAVYHWAQGDSYQTTLSKLQELLEARERHYSIADVVVPLAHPAGDAGRGAAPATVAHRCPDSGTAEWIC